MVASEETTALEASATKDELEEMGAIVLPLATMKVLKNQEMKRNLRPKILDIKWRQPKLAGIERETDYLNESSLPA